MSESKLNAVRARHASSNIPRPSGNVSWHEEQSYGSRIMAEYDKARAAAPDDIAYLLSELDAAHTLISNLEAVLMLCAESPCTHCDNGGQLTDGKYHLLESHGTSYRRMVTCGRATAKGALKDKP